MKVMFVGTSSGAGKTTISALFCRYLRSKMMTVSPFKALNLSSVSFKTDDDSEIGVGQAVQAWASDLKPDKRMNPILLKAADGKLKLLINGKEADRSTITRKEMLAAALRSYDELCDMYDAVVAEGSGSPAEINLRDHDIANAGFAAERNIPMILIGDIQKGGVFAALYGTWRLMKETERRLLKGFIINKYHGEKEILRSGIELIESLTGMRCLGILPYAELTLPEEDSGNAEDEYSDDRIDAFLEILDRTTEEMKEHMDMECIVRIATE